MRPDPGGAPDPQTFFFQHGMGGQRSQPLGYVAELPGVDLVCMDARGHGDSSDIVGTDGCGFDAYADDVIALADHLELDTFVMGGISLGAAVALNLVSRYPGRVSALVLCRPAWLATAQEERNRNAYNELADLLDTTDVDEALAGFVAAATHRDVQAESPNAAQSLRHQITRPRAAVNVEILRRFPFTAPISI